MSDRKVTKFNKDENYFNYNYIKETNHNMMLLNEHFLTFLGNLHQTWLFQSAESLVNVCQINYSHI